MIRRQAYGGSASCKTCIHLVKIFYQKHALPESAKQKAVTGKRAFAIWKKRVDMAEKYAADDGTGFPVLRKVPYEGAERAL